MRRLLLLCELAAHGEVMVASEEVDAMRELLWNEAKEVHRAAGEELDKIPAAAPSYARQASELAVEYEREAEVCARLIEQVSASAT